MRIRDATSRRRQRGHPMNVTSPIIRRFRSIAIAEGISFLVLLFIAMPLKYIWAMPLAVKYTGWAHGLLFIAYFVAAVPLFTKLKWPMERLYGLIAASVLPFGTFVLERKWLR
jgi:integral membrane protein